MPGFSPVLNFQGKIYHAIGPLRPKDGQEKKFAQMYIHDGNMDDEVDIRMKHGHHNVNRTTLKKLQEMLHETNPYVKSLKALMDLPEENIQNLQFVLKRDKKPSQEHNRKYNMPSCNEIALIQLNDTYEPADVLVREKEGGVRHMSDLNRAFDPLHFVLLFPDGRPGWTVDLLQDKQEDPNKLKKVSANDFYNYHLQQRDEKHHFNTIPRSGRLMQEYACCEFSKIERQRLRYIETHQKDIRAEKYNVLDDAIHAQLTKPTSNE